MVRKRILLTVILSAVTLVVVAMYGYSVFSSGPRPVSVRDLLASPTQFQGQHVKVRGNLRVIYPSNTNATPQFFLDDNASSVRVEFPEAIWGSPPSVGLFIGNAVEIVGTVRIVTFGQEASIFLEVQTMTLVSGT